jgi:hypothetical protein
MKSIYKLAGVSAIALSAFAFVAAPESAAAATLRNHPGGAYCLQNRMGGSGNCSFKTLQQCQDSASGNAGGQCFVNVFHRDASSL